MTDQLATCYAAQVLVPIAAWLNNNQRDVIVRRTVESLQESAALNGDTVSISGDEEVDAVPQDAVSREIDGMWVTTYEPCRLDDAELVALVITVKADR